MRTASILTATGVLCFIMVIGPLPACFSQDRPMPMDRVHLERAASAPVGDREHRLKSLKDQLKLLDLEQKIFQENEQKQALYNEQRKQQLQQQIENVDLEEKIQQLREQQQALQQRQRREDLKRQVDMLEMERKVSELNSKRQALNHQQRREDLQRQIELLTAAPQKSGESPRSDSTPKHQ